MTRRETLITMLMTEFAFNRTSASWLIDYIYENFGTPVSELVGRYTSNADSITRRLVAIHAPFTEWSE
jgi:hypothetical protein